MLCIHLLVHVPLDAISEGEGSSIGSDGRVESALVLVGPFAHNSKFAYDYSILHVVAYMHMIDQQTYMYLTLLIGLHIVCTTPHLVISVQVHGLFKCLPSSVKISSTSSSMTRPDTPGNTVLRGG